MSKYFVILLWLAAVGGMAQDEKTENQYKFPRPVTLPQAEKLLRMADPDAWMYEDEETAVFTSAKVVRTPEGHERIRQLLHLLRHGNPPVSEAFQKTEALLDKKVTLHLDPASLETLLEELHRQTGANFVRKKVPITYEYDGEEHQVPDSEIWEFEAAFWMEDGSLRGALNLLKRQTRLDWRVTEEGICISSDFTPLELRIHRLPECLEHLPPSEEELFDNVELSEDENSERLEELITRHVAYYKSWDEAMNEGSLMQLRKWLVVSQTSEMHREVGRFLALMDGKPVEYPNCERFLKALDTPVTLDYRDATLPEIVEDLRERLALPIMILERVNSSEVGLTKGKRYTLTVQDTPLGQALDQILAPDSLAWIIGDGCLLLGSDDDLIPQNLEPRLYTPQADFMNSEELAENLQTVFYPEDKYPGWQEISPFGDELLVTCTTARHAQFRTLFAFLSGEIPEPAFPPQYQTRAKLWYEFHAYPLPKGVDLDCVAQALRKLAGESERGWPPVCAIYVNSPELPDSLWVWTTVELQPLVKSFLDETFANGRVPDEFLTEFARMQLNRSENVPERPEGLGEF